MRPIIRLMLGAAPLLVLCACSKDSDPGPGGVTQGEAKALDEAAQMLEQRPAAPVADASIPVDEPSASASGR